jgi:glutamate transport system permease protein
MNLSLSWVARWVARRTASKTGRPGPDPDDADEEMLRAQAIA